jgi:hypothetical protein
MTQNNNLPLFAEEVKLPEEQNLENILAKFNQLVPTNFVQLATVGKNYMCATTG